MKSIHENFHHRSAGFQPSAHRTWRFATAPGVCPDGTTDNSPRFERWEPAPDVALAPKGRLREHRVSAVPSGLTDLCGPLPNVETLGYCRPSLRDENELRVATGFKPSVPGPSGLEAAALRCRIPELLATAAFAVLLVATNSHAQDTNAPVLPAATALEQGEADRKAEIALIRQLQKRVEELEQKVKDLDSRRKE